MSFNDDVERNLTEQTKQGHRIRPDENPILK